MGKKSLFLVNYARAMSQVFDLSKGVKLFQNLSSSGTRHVFNVVGSWMSEKYDGVRAIYLGNKKLVTCRGLRIEAPSSFFSEFPEGYVLDGELWISHHNFDMISGLARKSFETSPIWESVKFLVFDIIHSYDSRFDVLQMSFEERQELLTKLLPSYEVITPTLQSIKSLATQPIVDSYTIHTPSAFRLGLGSHKHTHSRDSVVGCGDTFSDSDSESDNDLTKSDDTMHRVIAKSEPQSYQSSWSQTYTSRKIYRVHQYEITSLEAFRKFYATRTKQNAEGVVVIPRGEKYRPGVRSNYKLKEVDEVEGVVVDYKEGNGKNTGLVGSFTVKMVTSEGKVLPKTFSIGTGLSQYQRQHGRELYPIGTVLTCHYNGLTASGIPRFPRLKGVRPDITISLK